MCESIEFILGYEQPITLVETDKNKDTLTVSTFLLYGGGFVSIICSFHHNADLW